MELVDMKYCNPALPIADSSSGNTVYFSPLTAIFQNLSSGTVLTGLPGRGKTTLLMKIISNALDAAMIVKAVDPKNDLQKLVGLYPDLKSTDVVNQAGVTFDPLFIKSMSAVDVLSFLKVLLPDKHKEIDQIIPIVQDFVKRRDRTSEFLSLGDMTRYLYGHATESARTVGISLNLISDDALGSIFFGKAGDKALSISLESEIITLGSIDIEAKPDTMNGAIAATIMYMITYMLNKAMEMNKERHPILIAIDEFKIAQGSKEITAIVEKLLILGRSLRIATILSSQNITHISPDLSGMFATKFTFEMDEDNAVEFARRFIKKEFSKATIARLIEAMPKYKCLMVDKSRNIDTISPHKLV